MSSAAPHVVAEETAIGPAAAAAAKKRSVIRDYFQLFKVRVTSLIVMTAWTGYYMGAAKSGVSSLSFTLLNALLGIGLTSAGAAALNEAGAGQDFQVVRHSGLAEAEFLGKFDDGVHVALDRLAREQLHNAQAGGFAQGCEGASGGGRRP